MVLMVNFTVWGSSPRVRGAGYRCRHTPLNDGIIPARAGSSSATSSCLRSSRDHPRACGEQPPTAPRKGQRMGSSPRVRGAVAAEHVVVGDAGIIPARAGSRWNPSRASTSRWDHPRACGEQTPSLRTSRRRRGSSPRVRGADFLLQHARALLGIIPARAGSRRETPRSPSTAWDHPRACGEQAAGPLLVYELRGSSPRVRGAELFESILQSISGIIPARAGSSFGLRCTAACRRDHPRACGEQPPASHPRPCRWGSSPRVRGAVFLIHR